MSLMCRVFPLMKEEAYTAALPLDLLR
jgi:hypothetical protein